MNILILSPHTDDGEYGCGGSIARFISEGKDVFYVAFSTAEKSVPSEYPQDILHYEVKEAMDVLGVKNSNLILLNYAVREFPANRQLILNDILAFKKDFNPDMVILPSTCDTHQDHQVIAQEGFRAFKDVTMMGYEVLRNNLIFPTNVFVTLNKRDVLLKMKAVECYRSQMGRPTSSAKFYENLAMIRGAQIGIEYAEAFEGIRWVIK